MKKQKPDLKRLSESLIIPVYQNSENIPGLLNALKAIASARGKSAEFEVVFVVDGSPDNSHELLAKTLPDAGFSSRLISLNENTGAFSAIRTGIEHARGENIAVMSADLQEPPELIQSFFEALKKDAADVIFGQRTGRNDPLAEMFFSRLYWGFYRRCVQKAVPPGGADMFAFNGRIKKAVLALDEPRELLVPQLFRLGPRRLFIPYERQKRTAGRSGWSLRKKGAYAAACIRHYAPYRVIFFLWLAAFGPAAFLFYKTALWPHPGLLFAACALLSGLAALGTLGRRFFERTRRRLPAINSIKHFVNGKL